ncbi:putative defective phage integrase [Escherichia coli P0302293.9]|nr:putative defective phage integrase [Escherichia coli P0302293.9]
MLYLRHNGLATIQVPKFCKELELDFNDYMVFPKVSDGITQVSVDNNLISRVDSSPSKAMKIFIYRNKIW